LEGLDQRDQVMIGHNGKLMSGKCQLAACSGAFELGLNEPRHLNTLRQQLNSQNGYPPHLEGHGGHLTHVHTRSPQRLRHVPVPAADAVRLVEKVFAIAERLLGVLIDRHADCLDVLVAPSFPHR
jgi:hypothetical protein